MKIPKIKFTKKKLAIVIVIALIVFIGVNSLVGNDGDVAGDNVKLDRDDFSLFLSSIDRTIFVKQKSVSLDLDTLRSKLEVLNKNLRDIAEDGALDIVTIIEDTDRRIAYANDIALTTIDQLKTLESQYKQQRDLTQASLDNVQLVENEDGELVVPENLEKIYELSEERLTVLKILVSLTQVNVAIQESQIRTILDGNLPRAIVTVADENRVNLLTNEFHNELRRIDNEIESQAVSLVQ